MSEIQLVRIRYLQRFARALRRNGASLKGPLASANLDPSILDLSDGFIPMSQLHAFASAAVDQTGIYHLGLDAGISPRSEHSDFSHNLAVAPKLYDTLQELIGTSKTEDTTATFRVVNEEGFAWLCCSRIRGDAEAARQIELFRYGALLEVVRYAAGPDWLPPVLKLQSRDDGRLRNLPLIRDSSVNFGAGRLAIAMEPDLLGKPLRQDDPLLNESVPVTPLTGPESFDQVIREVIATNIKIRRISLAYTASGLGVSLRTLQRRLEEAGTSYSKLLEDIRISRAKEMLDNRDTSICVIASRLGYRHNTHFSRAFKRVCGKSPRQYRSLLRG